MATFDDSTVGTSTGGTTPDFGLNRRSAPKITRTQFEDGFEQRIKFGLHTDPKEWSLKWTTKDETDADAIEAFFAARVSDSASFDWTPPNESSASKWIVTEWNRTQDYATVSTITAVFNQVFEP